jgi:chromate transporter
MQGVAEPVITAANQPKTIAPERGSALEVLGIFLRLGVTSFGGPVAHLGYYRAEFVERRKWLDEHTYADIVALWQFLPGPTSSQVGITLGIMRAGLLGALAAWIGFTMPSAAVMILFGYGLTRFGDLSGAAWLHGLKIVAVAVVAQAVWGMAQSLRPDRAEPLRIWATIAVGAAIVALAVPSAIGQVGAILAGALIGWALLGTAQTQPAGVSIAVHIPRAVSIVAAILFVMLLVGLPLLAAAVPVQPIKLLDSFYRSGALVFGGGHVVLPLLREAFVAPGWVSDDAFLAGYGAAQAVPGPLFTFAAYLGAVVKLEPNGLAGAALGLIGIFLPGILILIGMLPFWDAFRMRAGAQAAMRGVNAAVVGLLGAALYNPVWTTSVKTPADFAIALVSFVLLMAWRAPPLVVVIVSALGGIVLAVATA